MSDLIERQAAIDAIERNSCNTQRAIDAVNALPSAQPEIIRCKDCKWKNNHNCTRAVEVWIDDNKYCAWAERRSK